MTKDFKHGCGGYTNHKCRCDDCRKAFAAYVKKRNYEREQLLLADPTLAPHGVASTYGNWRCRCTPCTKAWSASVRERRVAKIT